MNIHVCLIFNSTIVIFKYIYLNDRFQKREMVMQVARKKRRKKRKCYLKLVQSYNIV